MSDNPGVLSKPNAFDSIGFLISAPTRRTFMPACAMVMEKLMETKVFPSCGEALVIAMDLMG